MRAIGHLKRSLRGIGSCCLCPKGADCWCFLLLGGEVSYMGSKAVSGACEAIIASMPAHDVYIEPFLGTGVVGARKPRALRQFGVDRLQACIDGFRYAGAFDSLVCGDAFEFLAGFDYAGSGEVFVYCDPPYDQSVRSAKRYRFDFAAGDHRRLWDLLRLLPAKVAVSGYSSPLYESLYASWRCRRFQVMTRGGVRTECLWMNYPEGDLFSPDYAGLGFTDRQRIRRKASRWRAKYLSMPAAERLAVLQALLVPEGR